MLYFIEGTKIEVKIIKNQEDSYYNITASKPKKLSRSKKDIFKVVIKREFIEHVKNALEINRKAFVNLKSDDRAIIDLKVKNGFLKVKTKIYEGTTITVSVIVDDNMSFGKIKVDSSELLKIYYSIIELEQHGD